MDHKAVDLFAEIFRELANDQLLWRAEDEVRALARKVWKHTKYFDFAPWQLRCGDELVTLRLATRVPNPYNPDETELEYAQR